MVGPIKAAIIGSLSQLKNNVLSGVKSVYGKVKTKFSRNSDNNSSRDVQNNNENNKV
jgi:hypothetical protein